MADLVAVAAHGKPVEDMECMCCMDDIDETNYVEYRTGEGKEWLPAQFCMNCIAELRKRQWPNYEESLGKATCKAQQKRMLGTGPPTHIKDDKALPCPEGEQVHSLWYMCDGKVHSALLDGAPQGEARQKWWDEKLAFQFDEDEEEPPTKSMKSNEAAPTMEGAANPATTVAEKNSQETSNANVAGEPMEVDSTRGTEDVAATPANDVIGSTRGEIENSTELARREKGADDTAPRPTDAEATTATGSEEVSMDEAPTTSTATSDSAQTSAELP